MNGFGGLTSALGIDKDDKVENTDVENTDVENTEVENTEVEEETYETEEEDETEETEEEVKGNIPPLPQGDSNKFEDNYRFEETNNFSQEIINGKTMTIMGGLKMGETNLIFKGDDFLTGLLNKELYTIKEDTLQIPLEHKELYKSKVDVENVEQIIEDAFTSNQKRVSFALEELGLHNRLIEMGEVLREFNDFTLIKTDSGNIVVHHKQNSLSDIEKEFMEEAKACLREGKRIVINLLEDYTFDDGLGLQLKRKRFRASFAEIKNFISRTQMQGTITKDSMLVISE